MDEEGEEIPGHEGDPYETEEKEFDNYKFRDATDNTAGTRDVRYGQSKKTIALGMIFKARLWRSLLVCPQKLKET